MSGILWSSAARGSRVIPCVLVAGLPVILIPEGVTLTGWSAGALDAAWWPGSSFAGFSAYLRPWLSLDEPLAWSERAQPVQPEMLDVSAITVRIADLGLGADGDGGLATALFASRDSLNGTWITADITTASTVISVASTVGFPSSGFLYVGRETMAYTSITSTSFAVGSAANRGRFGSPVQHHWFTGNGNAAIGNPEVTTAAPEIIGRTATVWLLEVSPAGVVTAGALMFYGTVGSGVVIAEEGEAWTFRIDHVIKRLATPLRGETITLGGYVHDAPAGNRGAGATDRAVIGRLYCPTYDYTLNSSLDVTQIFTLTRAAAAPDNGGFHPDAESYVRDLSLAVTSQGASYRLSGGKLQVLTSIGPSDSLVIGWPWETGTEASALPAGTPSYTSAEDFPGAWVPIFTDSRVYLSASDYALIPATPSSAIATVFYALAVDRGEGVTWYARITGKASSGSLYWATCTAQTRGEQEGVLGFGFVVDKPSTARIVCYVQAADWVSALQAVVEAFDTSLAENVGAAFDWDDMRDVVAQYPVGPYGSAREYVVDLSESALDLLTRECRLNGFTLRMKAGRISVMRFADFAPTEVTERTITTEDLHAQEPRPQYSRGFDGIVNAVTFRAPKPIDITVNIVDATSLAAYGPGRARIEATAPQQISGTVVNPAAEYLRLAAQAAQVLGPLRYPYEHVTFTTPLQCADLDVGALVLLSLWRVPDQQGARGLSSRMAQIVGREHTFYGTDDARVTYTCRISPARLSGWAPAVLVDGISGADITADTSTFGAAGFAPSGSTGGVEWFEVGDAVRLVEIGTVSPTASTQHTVTGVSGSVITVSPSPSATFVGLAASPLKVMVIPDDWTAVTVAQQLYAYLADTTYRLDSNTRARVYAA